MQPLYSGRKRAPIYIGLLLMLFAIAHVTSGNDTLSQMSFIDEVLLIMGVSSAVLLVIL